MKPNFTDLILIIGTNPLPNYVAASYFLQNNKYLKRIWMICSEKNEYQISTKEYGDNLKKILDSDSVAFEEIIFIENINRKKDIEGAARKLIEKLKNKSANDIHLFYTGGTKSEVVHIYNYLSNNWQNITFSYLSARDFKLYFDDELDQSSDDLRKEVKISFNDLCSLHSFRVIEDGNTNIPDIYDRPLEELSKLIQEDKINEFYNEKKGGYNRNKFYDKNFLKIKKIKENLKDFKPNTEFKSVCDAFPADYLLFKSEGINENLSNKKLETIIKDFLDGKWLEMYIKKVIENNKEDIRYDELVINKEISNKNSSSNKFELDVVMLKGYQLVGISCTTSNEKHLCKSKGFEVILRTRQIGGEEAKAILITRADKEKTNELQNELILTTGTAKENILVLGIDYWKEDTLCNKISNFLDWRLL